MLFHQMSFWCSAWGPEQKGATVRLQKKTTLQHLSPCACPSSTQDQDTGKLQKIPSVEPLSIC